MKRIDPITRAEGRTHLQREVHIDVVAAPQAGATVAAALVHFAPGARTAWHAHPLGQTIFVTESVGVCQRDGGPVELIRAGGRVFFAAGGEPPAWSGSGPLHGPPGDPAAADRFMAHLAIQRQRTASWPTWRSTGRIRRAAR